MASIITLAVSVGVGGRPADAPQEGPFEITTYVVKEVGFVDAINAVSVVVLAYAGTPNFLNIVGEMRDQRSKSVVFGGVRETDFRLHQKRDYMPNIRYRRIPSHWVYRLSFHWTIHRLPSARVCRDIDEEDLLWAGYPRVVGWVYLVYPYACEV